MVLRGQPRPGQTQSVCLYGTACAGYKTAHGLSHASDRSAMVKNLELYSPRECAASPLCSISAAVTRRAGPHHPAPEPSGVYSQRARRPPRHRHPKSRSEATQAKLTRRPTADGCYHSHSDRGQTGQQATEGWVSRISTIPTPMLWARQNWPSAATMIQYPHILRDRTPV